MADIEAGSLAMAGADKAAAAIGLIITDQVAAVIDQAVAEGKITNAKGIVLKAKGRRISAHVMELVMGYHSDLIDEAQQAGVDLPPPTDGTLFLIDLLQNMVSPLGGTR